MKKSISEIKFEILLDKILEEKGITVSRMAKELGISRSILSNLKNKLPNFPQLNTLLIICNYLQIQLSELININYNEERAPEKKK